MRILLIAITLYIAIVLWDGVDLLVSEERNFTFDFVILLMIFAFIEILLYPILQIITLPIRWLTLGFSSMALSIGIIYGIAYIYDPFTITYLLQGITLGAIFGIIRVVTDE